VISYLILLALYAQFISLKQAPYYGFNKLIRFLLFGLLLAYTLTSMLIAQMIGSNNATVVVAGLGLITIAIVMLLWLKTVKRYLSARPLNFSQLVFGKLSSRLIVFGSIGAVILVVTVLTVSAYMGIDLSMTRLGGFGSGGVSSVSSRLELLDNFGVQFAYSPIFGNINVACLTTGCGSYVHSFLATVLTHTGLIGFFILLSYFILAYKERLIMLRLPGKQVLLTSNVYNLFTLLLFSGILFVAILATSLTWATLWFAVGLFFNAIVFKSRYE
jgi:hypothetical protein